MARFTLLDEELGSQCFVEEAYFIAVEDLVSAVCLEERVKSLLPGFDYILVDTIDFTTQDFEVDVIAKTKLFELAILFLEVRLSEFCRDI